MSQLILVKDFYAWKTVVEVPVVEQFIPGIFNVKSILYVGVRPEGWGECPSPNSLEQALRKVRKDGGIVDGLERWPKYCERIRANPPCWLGVLHELDITSIRPCCLNRLWYDLVIWWHGPEHAESAEKGRRGLATCESIASHRVLLGMPWGVSQNVTNPGFPDDPENPYEAHGWQPTPEILQGLGYNVVALNCREPEEEDRSDSGHIFAWKDVG